MVEKDMQTIFSKYVKTHLPETTEVYELKICKGTSLPFSALQEHQEKALLEAQEQGLFHKLTDPPIFYGGQTRFNVPRPFDCMALVKAKAYVVVWFYHLRQKKVFLKIPIKTFIQERETSTRKSLTEQRATEIAEVIHIT